MLTLVEIAETEAGTGGVVLFDSSIFDLTSLLDYIDRYRQYSKLDKQLLEDKKQYIEKFLSFVKKENVFTVEKMLKDFESLDRAISTKKKPFNARQKGILKKYGGNAAQPNQKQLLLEDISNNVSEIMKLIKPKVFQPDDDLFYSELYKNLRYCFNENKHLPFLTPAYEKDMRLLVSAIYLLIEQKSVACVTNSYKFKKCLKEFIESFKGISTLKRGDVINFILQPDSIRLYSKNKHEDFQLIYLTKK